MISNVATPYPLLSICLRNEDKVPCSTVVPAIECLGDPGLLYRCDIDPTAWDVVVYCPFTSPNFVVPVVYFFNFASWPELTKISEFRNGDKRKSFGSGAFASTTNGNVGHSRPSVTGIFANLCLICRTDTEVPVSA